MKSLLGLSEASPVWNPDSGYVSRCSRTSREKESLRSQKRIPIYNFKIHFFSFPGLLFQFAKFTLVTKVLCIVRLISEFQAIPGNSKVLPRPFTGYLLVHSANDLDCLPPILAQLADTCADIDAAKSSFADAGRILPFYKV